MCGFPFWGPTAFTLTTVMSSPDWTRVVGHFTPATGKELLWDLGICAFDYNNKKSDNKIDIRTIVFSYKKQNKTKGQHVVSGQYSPHAPNTFQKAGWLILLLIRKTRNKCGVFQNELFRCKVAQNLVTEPQAKSSEMLDKNADGFPDHAQLWHTEAGSLGTVAWH